MNTDTIWIIVGSIFLFIIVVFGLREIIASGVVRGLEDYEHRKKYNKKIKRWIDEIA